MNLTRIVKIHFILIAAVITLSGCGEDNWNNPYLKFDPSKNLYFGSFSSPPKTLDPARSYVTNEWAISAQIYEPPLQYHFLKRPYQLIPLSAETMPTVKYYDKNNNLLPADVGISKVAKTVYEIQIKHNIYYQPHPAFSKNDHDLYTYHNITAADLKDKYSIADFEKTDYRELIAEDYVYQIKRLADPKNNSPIFGVMSEHIAGMKGFRHKLQQVRERAGMESFIDLRQHEFEGVKTTGKYSYQITISEVYPQLIYWLAMPFFSPTPWEADKFYSQPLMIKKNFTFDWFPVGTGPYMLTKNNPSRQIVLQRNPNFHGEFFPKEGEAEDFEKGLMDDAGKPIPFIDTAVYNLEKESIPRWSKFLQGYYDISSIGSDNFDQAIQISKKNQPELTSEMEAQGLQLRVEVSPSIFYVAFNMLDSIVGGSGDSARKLRQAISLALDYDSYIEIFLNGRGVLAHSPLPPGIFGQLPGEQGINRQIYEWQNNEPRLKDLTLAKKLLAEAGYPGGFDQSTGEQLILNYDVALAAAPDQSAQFDWLRKQFHKLDIQLNIRSTDFNRFQQKIRSGKGQIYTWGWHADYPDPENFLFLLYSKNGKVKYGGENAANYSNQDFDKLFERMKNLPDGDERQKVITQMITLVQNDAPWVFAYHPKFYQLFHQWVRVLKVNEIANNTLKYARVDPSLRVELQSKWNHPVRWPLYFLIGLIVIGVVPVSFRYWKGEHRVKALTRMRPGLKD